MVGVKDVNYIKNYKCDCKLTTECDGQNAVYRHHFASHFPHLPFRHLADYSHSLAIERLLNALDYLDMADAAIDVHNKAAHHATLNLVVVGVIRIFACGVDKVHKSSLTARELRLNIYKIIFIHVHHHHAIAAQRIVDAHATHL